MSFVAIAIGTVAVGASAFAASQSASASKKAQQQNLSEQERINLLNTEMQLASRGAPLTGDYVPDNLQGQQSSVLPYYFGGTEKQTADDTAALYNAIQKLYGSPDSQIADYQRLVDQYGPANASNQKLVNDLSSGRLTDQALTERAPVFGQRLANAGSNRNAGIEALQDTLNEIDAIQAGKGFAGDTVGSRTLRFNARRAIGTQSAQDLGQAKLQNATDTANIQDTGRALRLSNLSLPDQMLQSAITRKQIPAAGVVQAQGTAMAPFKFFDIGPGAPTQYKPFQFQPQVSTGQIVAQGVAGLGTKVLSPNADALGTAFGIAKRPAAEDPYAQYRN